MACSYGFQCLLTVKTAMKQNSAIALDPLLSEVGREKVKLPCSMKHLHLFPCLGNGFNSYIILEFFNTQEERGKEINIWKLF